MHKIILLSLFCFSLNSFAQKSFLGVDAGINVANQQTTYPLYAVRGSATSPLGTKYFNNTVKPTFGFYYQYQFLSKFAIRVNARYMGLGFKGGNGQFNVANLEINYLTFPISFKYFFTNRFNVSAGPYLSFTLGGSKINNQDITHSYHKNDFGFCFGAEYFVYKNYGMGLNYFLGTKNIWLNDQGGIYKYYNRALQFTLIYKFKKKS